MAEFDVTIPGWASSAGKRTIIPVSVFGGYEKKVFEHAQRVHPIYIDYPYEKLDDVSIEIPSGWQIDSVPVSKDHDGHVVASSLQVAKNGTTLHITRKIKMDFLMLEQKYYAALRNFYQTIRTDDDGQILLQPGTTAAVN